MPQQPFHEQSEEPLPVARQTTVLTQAGTSQGLTAVAPPLLPPPQGSSSSPFSRQLSAHNLSMFYSQMGTMIEAGVPVQNALASLKKTSPSAMRPLLDRLAEIIQRGEPLHEALASLPDQFPALDCLTLGISEQSGALDKGLHALGDYYEKRAKARSKMISACILPAIVLVTAVFVIRLPALILGLMGTGTYGIGNFLFDTVGLLAALVMLTIAFVWVIRILLQTPGTRLATDRALNTVPLLGGFRFNYALSHWVESIRLMLNAGYGVLEAMEFSSKSNPSPSLTAAHAKARPLMNTQLDVAQALESTRFFPPMLIQFWTTGEQSGKMDDMLFRLSKYYEEVWQKKLDQIAAWLPKLIYGVVCIFVIYWIFQFFLAHLAEINGAMTDTP